MIEAEQEVNLQSKQVNILDKCFMVLKMPFPFSTTTTTTTTTTNNNNNNNNNREISDG